MLKPDGLRKAKISMEDPMAQAMHFDHGISRPAMIPGQGVYRLDGLAEASAWSAAYDYGSYPRPVAQGRAHTPKQLVADNDPPFSGSRIPVAGGMFIEFSAGDMDGVWSLRFGGFGCPDSEMRGGVVHIEDGLVVGGDSHFAYLGQWTLLGTELTASIEVTRHSDDDDMTSIFGGTDVPYRLDCVAEAITSDLLDGRIRREGFPDGRVTMRRLAFRPS